MTAHSLVVKNIKPQMQVLRTFSGAGPQALRTFSGAGPLSRLRAPLCDTS